jgi:glutamate--cysteine ligase
MPAPTRTLTLGSARDLIRERSFASKTGGRVGVELEWFTAPPHDPPDITTLEHLLGDVELPRRSSVTFEPGGQVELSTAPFDTITAACDAAEVDSDVVRRRLADAGHDTFAAGFDTERTQRLLTDAPRYVAMRQYFDTYGPAGGRMMCATSAIHVNVDAGTDAEGDRRWRVAHLAGPTLIAAFANSPLTEAGVSGYKSSRVAAWHQLDPTRTHPVAVTGDPVADWTSYALAARVMFIRLDDTYVPLDDGLTFGEWITDGHPLGFPDAGDLSYHLTTLFPPVRPHGHLELRMIDMLPAPWWRAAVALTTAVVCDPGAQTVAEAVCTATDERWELAAKCALEDPPLFVSANACFDAALAALDRLGCDATTRAAAHAYVERFTRRGLTPADELLAAGGDVQIATSRRSIAGATKEAI